MFKISFIWEQITIDNLMNKVRDMTTTTNNNA